MLINFPLDEAAVAGGGLKFDGDTLVLGAAVPEFAYSIHTDIGFGGGILGVGQYALDCTEERVLRQPA